MHQPGANRRKQLGHVDGGEPGQLHEARRAVGLFGEDAVQSEDVKMWIESAFRHIYDFAKTIKR
jgi:hypothetical protein